MMHVGVPERFPEVRLEVGIDNGFRVMAHIDRDGYETITIPPEVYMATPIWIYDFNRAHERDSSLVLTVQGEPIARTRSYILYPAGKEGPGDSRKYRIEYQGTDLKRVPPDNHSWWKKRLNAPVEFSLWERAFHEQWLKENDGDRNRGINRGCGLLQDLMLSTYEHESPEGFEPWLTNRERKIVATFVQWLGTNCGRSFLYEVTRRAGKPQSFGR